MTFIQTEIIYAQYLEGNDAVAQDTRMNAETQALLNGILFFIVLTGLMAIPWILIGRLIGNREEVISPLLKYRASQGAESTESDEEPSASEAELDPEREMI